MTKQKLLQPEQKSSSGSKLWCERMWPQLEYLCYYYRKIKEWNANYGRNRNRERRKTLYRKPIFVEWESQNYYDSCNDLIKKDGNESANM